MTADHGIEVARAYGYPLAEAWRLRARGRALMALPRTDEAQAATGSAIKIFATRHEGGRRQASFPSS